MSAVDSTLRQRLLSKAVIDWESGCWNWSAYKTPTGYGRINAHGKPGQLAHRVAYELFVAPIPALLHVDHLCRNRACINPAHLEPVTQRENTLRSPVAIAALYAVRTHCLNGHLLVPENIYMRGTARMCRTCRREQARRRKNAARAQLGRAA